MVELAQLLRVKGDLSFRFAVQLDGHLAVLELYNGREVAVRYLELLFTGCKLNSVSRCKLTFDFYKDFHSTEPLRVIDNGRSVLFLDCEHVGASVNRANYSKAVASMPSILLPVVYCNTSPRLYRVARPGSIRAGHIRAVQQDPKL